MRCLRAVTALRLPDVLSVTTRRPFSQPGTSVSEAVAPLPFDSIPGPKGLPFIGVSLKCREGGEVDMTYQKKTFTRLHETYGPVIRLHLGGGFYWVCTNNPDSVPAILASAGPSHLSLIAFVFRGHVKFRKDKGLPLGIATSEGEEWQRVRSIINKEILRPVSAATYLPVQSQVADDLVRLVRQLRDGNNLVHDTMGVTQRFALEAIGTVCLDARLGALDQRQLDSVAKEIISNLDECLALDAKMLYAWFWHKRGYSKTYKELCKRQERQHGFTDRFIKEAIARSKRNEKSMATSNADNFILRLNNNPELSPSDLIINVHDLLLAGIDTTGISTMFTLYHISRNPEVQEKLHQEVKAVIGDEEIITSSMLQQMKYLKMVVKESFRLHSVIRAVSKITCKDTVIDNYKIPANTMVTFSMDVANHSSTNWQDPDKFLPERWEREVEGARSHVNPYLVLPFSHGVRSCVGRRFAEQEIYLAVIKVMQNFRITCTQEELDVKTTPFLKPTHPVAITFQDR